MKQFKLEFTIY